MARWGMPSPRSVIEGRKSDPGVTNIRNVSSPHWRRWLGVDLFGFLTTEPNAEVKPIHPKAMPVILTTPAEVDAWLTAPTMDAPLGRRQGP